MLKLEFLASSEDNRIAIDSLTAGHMIVSGDFGTYSSFPDSQPVMLFPELCELLSGLLTFMVHRTAKQYIFRSLYGDYGLKVLRKGADKLSVYFLNSREILVTRASSSDVRRAVWLAAHNLYKKYTDRIDENAADSTVEVWESDIRNTLEALFAEWLSAFPELSKTIY